jgi:hypothetical protein
MVWNLSQNVDRDTMGKLGLCQCLTPTGIFYVTNRGGPLVGHELLALQGIPADDLILTKEGEDQLCDLAGNAMTTTVVGACILSALVQGHEALKLQPRLPQTPTDKKDATAMKSLVPRPLTPASDNIRLTKQYGDYETKVLDLGQTKLADKKHIYSLLRESWMSSRKCTSEGTDEALPFDSIVACSECGKTASLAQVTPSRKYEEHCFSPVMAQGARMQPSLFRRKLLDELLPMRVEIRKLDVESISQPVGVTDRLWNDWKLRVQSASSDGEFRFSHLLRTHIWTAHYASTSTEARLELRLHKNAAEWLLFAKANPTSKKNKQFADLPVARLKVDVESGSIISGAFEVCLPIMEAVNLSIESCGEPVPSWRCSNGLLGEFKDEKQYEKLKIDVESPDNDDLKAKINGTYSYLHKCGGACGSMHRKDRVPGEDEDVFFFLESGRMSLPTDDAYMFSAANHRTSYGEYRGETFLQIDPKLEYRPLHTGPEIPEGNRLKKLRGLIQGKWLPLENVQLESSGSATQASCTLPTSSLAVPVGAGQTDDF